MYQTTIFVHASVSRIYGTAKERKLRVGQVHENLCSLVNICQSSSEFVYYRWYWSEITSTKFWLCLEAGHWQ